MLIEQPAKWLRWLYPRATWRMDKNERSVYLTFDDGPIPESTPFILETLKKFNAKATFFMVGENVMRHHDLYTQIVQEGHQVGNHTYNHIGSLKHWAITYAYNTEKANQLIHAHLFRPPHGWMKHSVYWWMSRRYRIIMWDVVTRDYSKWMTAEDIFENVKKYTRNGSIITFHDSLKSIEKLHYALPKALQWLKDQGYEFKTFE
ncbi:MULTISPECIES: polysaccharide deacetylase family protein [Segatella]|jgi:peptidoglycan/xylan/chitin deacetylase (PgdA/CDA1 family)|uniref:Polysaccharide deacetylase family protein n=2 Tax=Prevotellaceae TaxID=171552 RepID=A0ABX4EJ26_SEGBR|nr:MULTISPECIES: polysaccharide deacetylase family protein [Segatella]AGH13940.1 chitin deacetylase [Prevotella sp. Sc00026]MBQ3858542.1 polysaccharide deacetylase family protein [Prevotella sp.]MDR4930677.1 polysaccharide deacetylase family protein [Segatella bryantii]MEE3414636.1 polysaccharide deacetylase family protein [Prevotella sp.]OYP56206.1 polysaccharide deacetylase family protein [Segatella bryantii]